MKHAQIRDFGIRQEFQGIGSLKFNGLLVDAPKAKAHIFNEHFQSVFSTRSK